MVKNIAPVIRHVDVCEAVAVVIGGGHSHAEFSGCYSGLVRDICESPVVVIVIKRILERRGRRIEIGNSAIDEIDVHPPIIVIVKEGASRADCLRQVAFR